MIATEATRSFSEVLDHVAAGDEDVTRAGAPVATITPPKVRLLSAERFRELIASAPAPDDEFAGDLRALRKTVAPPEPSWPS